eukprot:364494-Chlamydomonas_euryale.AAC.10
MNATAPCDEISASYWGLEGVDNRHDVGTCRAHVAEVESAMQRAPLCVVLRRAIVPRPCCPGGTHTKGRISAAAPSHHVDRGLLGTPPSRTSPPANESCLTTDLSGILACGKGILTMWRRRVCCDVATGRVPNTNVQKEHTAALAAYRRSGACLVRARGPRHWMTTSLPDCRLGGHTGRLALHVVDRSPQQRDLVQGH